MLGAILAVLSAASFALNNAAARRAVVTGTPVQGVAVTVPIGILCFLPVVILTGAAGRLAPLPPAAVAWMASVGLVHFLIGRYCNYRANQLAGSNLTAPAIQLQVVVTLVLAVVILREPCTVLQAISGVIMLGGALTTQRQSAKPAGKSPGEVGSTAAPGFIPRRAAGYLFASLAALAYGTTPIMTRTALEHVGVTGGILAGLIAYSTATTAIALLLLASRPLRSSVMTLRRADIPWFVYSGVFVALAQGLLYSAVAVAPIMLVVPLTQSTLIFRLIFAKLLNPDHEVFGPLVIAGTAISIAGACAVSIDTGVILDALAVPEGLASLLRRQI